MSAFLILALSALISLSACASSSNFSEQTTTQGMVKNEVTCGQEIPQHMLTPELPTNDTPEEFAKFSGVWVGNWAGSQCATLVVSSITKNGKARVVYIWGDYQRSAPPQKAGWQPTVALISEGRLVLGAGSSFTPEETVIRWGEATYDFNNAGAKPVLAAMFRRYDGQGGSYGHFTKLK